MGTVKDTVAALLPLLQQKTEDKHLQASVEHYGKVRTDLDELAVGKPGQTPIHPQYVTRLIDEIASQDAVFTCDVGTPTIWAARYLSMNGQRRLLGSFNHGSMANALPQGIGAQAAFRERQVITLSGDGGIAMLLGDLLTLKQMNLPVKVVVFNNSALSFVELEMKAAGVLNFGTDLKNPSFAGIAQACGIQGFFVDKPEDLRNAIEQTFAHDGPALLDVVVNRHELSMPPNIDASQMAGFGLYVMRAVLNHRADEVIDLAKTNLFH